MPWVGLAETYAAVVSKQGMMLEGSLAQSTTYILESGLSVGPSVLHPLGRPLRYHHQTWHDGSQDEGASFIYIWIQ